MSETQAMTVADDAEGVVDELAVEPPPDQRIEYLIGGKLWSLPANLDDKQRKLAIANLINSDDFKSLIDQDTGAPATVRAFVGSAREEDRLANIQRYYPDAIPYGADNFAFNNPETGKITLYNPPGIDFGDVASVAKEATVFAGSALGATAGGLAGIAGGPAAPVTIPGGAVAGAGLGAAVAGELFDLSANVIGGRVDTRNVIDKTADAAFEFFLSATGQKAGDLVSRGVKRALGGGTQKAAELAAKFRSLKIEPSAGAVSSSNTIATLEKGLESTPFSTDVMQKSADAVLSQIQAAADDVVRQIGEPVSKQSLGETIRAAASAAAGRFKAKQNIAYEKAFDLIGEDAPVAVDNIRALRLELEAEVAQAPKALGRSLNKALGYLKIIEIDAANDEVAGSIPFAALRKIRTALGIDLKEKMLTGATGSENAAYERAYAALTLDLSAAAKHAGPQAAKAMAVADRYTRSFMNTAGQTLNKIGKFDTDERAFSFAMSKTQDGGTQLARLRQQFDPEEWDIVGASVLNRMGLASAGAQDATGELFSVNTFLTNWSKMSPEAKNALFGGKQYADMRKGLNTLVDVSSSLKGVEKFANTSNSGRVINTFMMLQVLGGAVAGMTVGSESPTSAVGGATVAALSPRLAAKLITSPRFVNWLATPITKPNAISAHLGRLSAIALEDVSLREPIQEFLKVLRSPPQPQGENE
jgi:hypothetical protein